MPTTDTLSTLLRDGMAATGHTSVTLAAAVDAHLRKRAPRRTGCTESAVRNWLSGYASPRAEALPTIARELRIDYGRLTDALEARQIERQAVAR